MEEWSSWKAWWLDLFKSIITFGLAALFSLLFLDRIEDENARLQFKWKKDYEINVKILDEFKKVSFLYQEAALDAYWETLQGDLQSPSIRRWQTESYNQLRLSLENVKSRFSAEGEQTDLSEEVAHFEGVCGQFFEAWKKVHDRILVDPESALASESIDAQLRSGVLDEFEALRTDYLEERRRIIYMIENDI